MESKFTDKNIILSLFWKLFERGGSQLINLAVSIVLARILLPAEFGIIAILTVFITIAFVLIQSGLGTALIQRKTITQQDLSTVFFMNIFIALIIYISIFFSAPLISNFFDMPEIKNYLRVLGLVLLPFSFNVIPNVIIVREMKFQKLFLSSLTASIVSGFIAITLAMNNFGAWAIVCQQLINATLFTLFLSKVVKWKPSLYFSWKRFISFLSFGWKLLISNLINVTYNEISSVLIGKNYSADLVGFFNRGRQLPMLFISNIDNAVQTVMLPVYSSLQDDTIALKKELRKAISYTSFIVFPSIAILFVISESLIIILFTEKWIESLIFMQIFCIAFAFQPLQTANMQAINAIGRSDVYLKLEIFKKIVGITLLIIAVKISTLAVALVSIVYILFSISVNVIPNKKYFNYFFSEQLTDIIPSLIISVIMGISIYFLNPITNIVLINLFLQITIGSILYLLLAYIFKIRQLIIIVNELKLKYKKNL